MSLVWLLGANLWIHPHYLSYFNELIGGPANGHLYLADSNIDWGQDLKRLAAYARRHPEEKIKLAYFGSADPTRYGFACQALPSFLSWGRPAELEAGTYVVSVTQRLGVYYPLAREAWWKSGLEEDYLRCRQVLSRPLPGNATPQLREQYEATARYYEQLRRGRLLNRLLHRPPDERIGYSLFVYRLTQAEVDAMLEP